MWSKISNALKPREGSDSDPDHADVQSTTPSPDPFRVNAATYYTHQTPPTPPSGTHSRTASREEDIIWSLRTQLALQQELCAQFEIDLGARDELVAALTTRLEASEKENDKRKSVIRLWKKKAADLEKMCRYLEEEVDNSRRESMERSIMDEASGEALRQLHRQISQLEREKNEAEAERSALAQAAADSKAELRRLREKLDAADNLDEQTVYQLNCQISRLEHERSSAEGERNALAQALKNVEDELSATVDADKGAQDRLRDQLLQLQRERCDAEAERDNFSSEISRLRTHIQQLQKDSAVMEVTIVQLNKQLDQDKEDIGGLNIALESKQQELELVKRKHGSRGAVGPTSGRTPPISGKPVAQTSKVTRPSAVRALSPVLPSAPEASVLGKATNTLPLTSTVRRASSSSVESKTKPSNRRASIAGMPVEADDKENTTTTVPLKNPRRAVAPA